MPTAIGFYEQQLIIVREIGDRRSEGNATGNMGNAHAALGDPRMAVSLYEQQLIIAREIGDQRGEGNALCNSATELWEIGDQSEAIARAEAASIIYRAIEDPSVARVQTMLAAWRTEAV